MHSCDMCSIFLYFIKVLIPLKNMYLLLSHLFMYHVVEFILIWSWIYQGRKYAFKKVQTVDPSSTQRGVRQFKTYMSIKLDQVS